MNYTHLLFDADDTLFDFKACELTAFGETLKHLGHTADPEPIYKTYETISLDLWRALEQGKITKDHLKTERFRKTFEAHEMPLPAEEAGEAYLDILPRTCRLIDHALELCRDLSQTRKIGIITNGFEKVQTRRLEASGLKPYIHLMVVSEQCGYTKPDIRFFDHTAKLIPGFDKAKTLVIGDRLETDIAGAHAYGLDACWFNPNGHASADHKPKFEIQHLRQLHDIV